MDVGHDARPEVYEEVNDSVVIAKVRQSVRHQLKSIPQKNYGADHPPEHPASGAAEGSATERPNLKPAALVPGGLVSSTAANQRVGFSRRPTSRGGRPAQTMTKTSFIREQELLNQKKIPQGHLQISDLTAFFLATADPTLIGVAFDHPVGIMHTIPGPSPPSQLPTAPVLASSFLQRNLPKVMENLNSNNGLKGTLSVVTPLLTGGLLRKSRSDLSLLSLADIASCQLALPGSNRRFGMISEEELGLLLLKQRQAEEAQNRSLVELLATRQAMKDATTATLPQLLNERLLGSQAAMAAAFTPCHNNNIIHRSPTPPC